eukprot:3705290-Rhodomonas_salina.4
MVLRCCYAKPGTDLSHQVQLFYTTPAVPLRYETPWVCNGLSGKLRHLPTRVVCDGYLVRKPGPRAPSIVPPLLLVQIYPNSKTKTHFNPAAQDENTQSLYKLYQGCADFRRYLPRCASTEAGTETRYLPMCDSGTDGAYGAISRLYQRHSYCAGPPSNTRQRRRQ